MRIGIDMLAVQSPGSRGRGVGRYGHQFVATLLERSRRHQYALYAHDGLPTDQIPVASNATTIAIRPDPELGETRFAQVIDRVARTNPNSLDVLLTLNPFEQVPGYDPPLRPLHGPKLASIVFDLIPFLFPEQYLSHPPHSALMFERLRTLRNHDVLLAISESTRTDCRSLLNLPAQRVVNIGGAVDAGFFKPDRSFPIPRAVRGQLYELGIRRSFVYCVAGFDRRKNLTGLLTAFARLPAEVKRGSQLVVTCYLREEDERTLHHLAAELGIGDALLLTGVVSDESLRVLYQRCAAFVFPSLYEGLGLPILEAMHCGAPVVAGRNSSQPEVVGEAGLLAMADDPDDLAAKMNRILTEPRLATTFGDRALVRARGFTWERTVDVALEAIERLEARPRFRAKPRLAIVSPWPPKATGIADYAVRLVSELRRSFGIDLYHEPGYVPDPALSDSGLGAHDHRLLARHVRQRGYRGILHQMGNSFYHGMVYDELLRHGGIVTLHDYLLAGFHWGRAHDLGGSPLENFGREVEHAYPNRAGEIVPNLEAWNREPGGMQEAFTRRRLYLNRRVFECAGRVVVHSPWCLEQVRTEFPEHAAKTIIVPLGAAPEEVDPGRRIPTRDRFGLPREALIVGCFGILSRAKMNVEAITAFGSLRDEYPGAILLFIGKDWENGEAQRTARELGLESRVRFLGRQSDQDYQELIGAVDLGLALRRPPTYGETSAALLDLLRRGVPAIVTETDTFADYPNDVVRKVRWQSEGHSGLVNAIRQLLGDRAAREALGRSALRHVVENHTWPRVAERYAGVIEEAFLARARGSRSIVVPA